MNKRTKKLTTDNDLQDYLQQFTLLKKDMTSTSQPLISLYGTLKSELIGFETQNSNLLASSNYNAGTFVHF